MSPVRDDSDAYGRRKTIGQRLREARKVAGLSQGQVAKMLDLHRPTVSEAEAGRRRVPAEELAQYANIYGVSASWLVNAEAATDEQDPRVFLAARELSKLSPADLQRVVQLLTALRSEGEEG